jgi:hypothetical protein
MLSASTSPPGRFPLLLLVRALPIAASAPLPCQGLAEPPQPLPMTQLMLPAAPVIWPLPPPVRALLPRHGLAVPASPLLLSCAPPMIPAEQRPHMHFALLVLPPAPVIWPLPHAAQAWSSTSPIPMFTSLLRHMCRTRRTFQVF